MGVPRGDRLVHIGRPRAFASPCQATSRFPSTSADARREVRLAELLQRAGRTTTPCISSSRRSSCARRRRRSFRDGSAADWHAVSYAEALRRRGALLERYRDSHRQSEDARVRFDARLSKARAIAERKRRSDTRMLASVRMAAQPSSRRTRRRHHGDRRRSRLLRRRRGRCFARRSSRRRSRERQIALATALPGCATRRSTRGPPPERMVAALKSRGWGEPPGRLRGRRGMACAVSRGAHSLAGAVLRRGREP